MRHVLEESDYVPVGEPGHALVEVVVESDRVPEDVGGPQDEQHLAAELPLVVVEDGLGQAVHRLEGVHPAERLHLDVGFLERGGHRDPQLDLDPLQVRGQLGGLDHAQLDLVQAQGKVAKVVPETDIQIR